jgi:hypothetical protein
MEGKLSMNFILGKNSGCRFKIDDLIVVDNKIEIYKYGERIVESKCIIYVMAIIDYEDFEDKPYNYSIVHDTVQNRQVVKTLHKSSKGIYFNNAETRARDYLSDDEIQDLNKYIVQYNKKEK